MEHDETMSIIFPFEIVQNKQLHVANTRLFFFFKKKRKKERRGALVL